MVALLIVAAVVVVVLLLLRGAVGLLAEISRAEDDTAEDDSDEVDDNPVAVSNSRKTRALYASASRPLSGTASSK